MQDGLVAGVVEGLEGAHLFIAGVGQQVQRLVGMRRDDDPVDPGNLSGAVPDLDTITVPGDVGDSV